MSSFVMPPPTVRYGRYRSFFLEMRLRSEGYDVVTQEVLRRATRPESLKLTAQEEDLGQRLDSINGTLSDPEAVRAWQDAKMKKWLERVEVEVERDRPRVTATVAANPPRRTPTPAIASGSGSARPAKRPVVDSDTEDDDNNLPSPRALQLQALEAARGTMAPPTGPRAGTGGGVEAGARPFAAHLDNRPANWRALYVPIPGSSLPIGPDSANRVRETTLAHRFQLARLKVAAIPGYRKMLPVIPNSFYRALPRTGPRSQSAIDQCLNPLTNELRPPTTVPPSPEFTSGFYFLDDILTFKVCTNSNQADYEAPLAQAYKNGTWAAGDVMLLAELVRQDLKSNKRAWRVGPEDKTYWSLATPFGLYDERPAPNGLWSPYSDRGGSPEPEA